MIYKADILPVCITYTADFQSMVNHACSTLAHPNIQVHLNQVTLDKNYEGFRSAGWFECLKRKMLFFYDFMSKLPLNAVACSIDGDIQFFNADALYKLKERLARSSRCCYGQTEHWLEAPNHRKLGVANGGFFMMKKTPAVMRWLKTVLSQNYTTQYLGDQEFLNHFLRKQRIPYVLLPPQEFMHGGPIVEKTENFVDPARLVMHHATWALNVDDKQNQMNVVRQMCNLPPVDWDKVQLDNPNVLHYLNGDPRQKTRPLKHPNALVLARYNEDLSWAAPWADKLDVFVYNKGAAYPGTFNATWLTLPNVGREAHTYLTHIIENYEQLHDVTIFLQGRIDDCHAHPADQLERYIAPAKEHGFSASQFILVQPEYWNGINFMKLQKYAHQVRSGALKLYKPSMLSYVYEHFGKMPVTMAITYCGCFAASRAAIRKRPVSFYEKLRETVSHHNGPEEAHFLERLWAYMFSGTAYVPQLLRIPPQHRNKFLY